MVLDIEGFRKAGYQAIDRLCDYYYSLQGENRPPVLAQVEPGYLGKVLPTQAPENGEDFQVIADDFQKYIMPGTTHWQHPSFFGYFPTASTYEGTLADLYASSVSSPGFNWLCSPAATELEAVTMDWGARMLGLDEVFCTSSGVGGGIIQPTASDSALTAVVAARSRYTRLHPDVDLQKLVIYGTTMTHSLGSKAALILGLSFRALDAHKEDGFGLRGETLRVALEEDEKAGKKPFILIVTVGTTSSGAIDRLDEVTGVAKANPDLWIHVDAAWAGVALACPEYREQCYLDPINQYAHSFCTNFHKWGLVNFESSGMWVRDRTLLTEALDVTPEFLRTKHGDAGTVIDYRNWQLALGRRFRSLKLWFVLRSYGVEGFRAHIRRGIELANHFESLMKTSKLFEVVTPRSFALVVFRVVPPVGLESKAPTLEDINKINRAFHSLLSARSKEVFIIQTDLAGMYCLRFVVGAERTQASDVDHAFKVFQEEAVKAMESCGWVYVENSTIQGN
ncbi:hypothetical protein FRC03_003326 [Tulasnella sp. 419]|nr:hypothetical protein FRC03_003326 [Tulasnella sp. 419]